jgi:ABC-2 type transport system ATP-binding protein
MAAPIIEAEGLAKRFGSTQALAGVDLSVVRGTVLALLGPNGAGKTTLVRILTTLLAPDRGRAILAGYDVVAEADRVRPLIGLAGQSAAVDEMLTGRENLELVGRLYHLGRGERRDRAREVLERFSLADAGERLVKTYSGGMRRRLDVGASLIGRTPVLILDEPTAGLDPRSRNELWDFIRELADAGTTVLLTTQYLEEADHLADRIVVIDKGTTVAEGTADALKDQIGGDVLEARVSSGDLDLAVAQLADLGDAPPTVDPHEQRISLPTKGGATVLVTAARRLDDAGVGLIELGLRRPSLDEVFLTLTGHSTVAPAEQERAPARQPSPADAETDTPVKTSSAPETHTNSSALADTLAITSRNVRRLARSPRMVMLSIINPIVLLVMFRYLLGGAIVVHGSSYVNYLLPGVFVAAVLVGGGSTAISITQDLQSGMIDRFRSLPIARSAVLAGRTLADQCRNLLALGVIIVLGWLVGFHFQNNAGLAIVGIALIALAGYAFSWLYAAIGIAVTDPETAYGASTLTMFLLLFASSAFVPIDTMPGWLQPIARVQPVTVIINAVRALMGGGPTYHWLWQSLLWCGGILLASITIAVRQYRRIGI